MLTLINIATVKYDMLPLSITCLLQALKAQGDAMNAYMASNNTFNKLPDVRNKVLYLHDALDILLPVKSAYVAAAVTPESDVIVTQGYGHGLGAGNPLQVAR